MSNIYCTCGPAGSCHICKPISRQELHAKDARIAELERLLSIKSKPFEDGCECAECLPARKRIAELEREVDGLLEGHAGDKWTVKAIGIQNHELRSGLREAIQILHSCEVVFKHEIDYPITEKKVVDAITKLSTLLEDGK